MDNNEMDMLCRIYLLADSNMSQLDKFYNILMHKNNNLLRILNMMLHSNIFHMNLDIWHIYER